MDNRNLAQQVLPMFRSRANLYRWDAVDRYCAQAWEGIEVLEQAQEHEGSAAVVPVVQKALTSIGNVLLHADDSNGSISDVFCHLLNLHATLCREAPPTTARLIAWLIKFQFGDGQDYFQPDVVDYAPALGPKGLAQYQQELDKIADTIPAEMTMEERRAAWEVHSEDPGAQKRVAQQNHARHVLAYNAERLAVAHRDPQRIVETHAGDQSRSYKLHNTAKAFAEIGEPDLAIDWAKRGALLEEGHQAEAAGEYWCQLLHEHRLEEELGARRTLFARWPRSSTANQLHAVAGGSWPPLEADVLATLAARPDDYVEFLRQTLQNVPLAWMEAHRLDLARTGLWDRLIAAYQVHDPAAVLPVLESIIEAGLTKAEVRNYKMAVARLKTHRAIATVAGHTEATAALLASLRERNRNRPRLLRELDRLKF